MQTADILKSIREKNNLTQDQMADRVMVSRQAVSRWENGEFSGGKTPPFRRSGNRDSGRLENVVPVMRKPLRVLFDRLFTAGYPA